MLLLCQGRHLPPDGAEVCPVVDMDLPRASARRTASVGQASHLHADGGLGEVVENDGLVAVRAAPG